MPRRGEPGSAVVRVERIGPVDRGRAVAALLYLYDRTIARRKGLLPQPPRGDRPADVVEDRAA